MAEASTFRALFSCGAAAIENPWAAFQDKVDSARHFDISPAHRRGSPIHTAFTLVFRCEPAHMTITRAGGRQRLQL
jgi:hypothetical protein